MTELSLLPNPCKIELTGGSYLLNDQLRIAIQGANASRLHFTAGLLKENLLRLAGVDWEIATAPHLPSSQVGILLSVSPGFSDNAQNYQLVVDKDNIKITAISEVGIFYGVQTFLQILEQCGSEIPQLSVSDHPEFIHRGILLDISRDKVPTMESLYRFVDLFSSWKINQLQLYTEHTFAYRNHSQVWSDASPVTGEEIQMLDSYCRERFIELVPNQNCFGHMNRWLQHPPYSSLAEAPNGFKLFGQIPMNPESLNPNDPGSLELVTGLFDELLPYFSSSQFNVNLDEAFELGEGKSKESVRQKGKGRVFLDYLLSIHQNVKQHKKTMMFWSDMLIGYPELIADLPKDSIVLEWGYEAEHPFDKRCRLLAENHVPFYVCPGTSSWCSITGRFDNAAENIANAAEHGLKHGAIGLLNTDWGDHGHWQTLPISMPGFIYGAAVSWNFSSNKDLDIASSVSRFGFGDFTGKIGTLLQGLGNIHLETGAAAINGTVLFSLLQTPLEQILEMIQMGDTGLSIPDILSFLYADQPASEKELTESVEIPREIVLQAYRGELFRLTKPELANVCKKVDEWMTELQAAEITRGEPEIVKNELRYAADLVKHACERGMWILDRSKKSDTDVQRRDLARKADHLLSEHSRIWKLRNRSGGLRDSLSRLQRMKDDYNTTQNRED